MRERTVRSLATPAPRPTQLDATSAARSTGHRGEQFPLLGMDWSGRAPARRRLPTAAGLLATTTLLYPSFAWSRRRDGRSSDMGMSNVNDMVIDAHFHQSLGTEDALAAQLPSDHGRPLHLQPRQPLLPVITSGPTIQVEPRLTNDPDLG